jgi:UDP-N-acetylglucosamine 2-epimerase (non-hydrolysing)
MKIAPILRALVPSASLTAKLVHTGQHYDENLSNVFFKELEIRQPDIQLMVGSGSHAVQCAEIMRHFEQVLEQEQPHIVLVVGDVNSTTACALTTAKFRLREPFVWRMGTRTRPVLIHVEAGLRSFDSDMPEEINRRVTDVLSDLLFVSDPSGIEHLQAEGVADERVFYVGNVMIDTLLANREKANNSNMLTELGLEHKGYNLLTLHRPRNVDNVLAFKNLLEQLNGMVEGPIVFPVHPRTHSSLEELDCSLDKGKWKFIDPVGYFDIIKLMSSAKVVFTDSGGIQEETTMLGVWCITLRPNTERPITLTEGTNLLVGNDPVRIEQAYLRTKQEAVPKRVPLGWDGHSAERIVKIVEYLFSTGDEAPPVVRMKRQEVVNNTAGLWKGKHCHE